MAALLLFAQQADPISGGGGWFGAGLLGLVLAWLLLRHLPGKDQQILDIINAFRVEARDLREAAQSIANATDARWGAEVGAIRAEMETQRRLYREENEAQRRAYIEILDRVAAKFEQEVAAERSACERSIEAIAKRIDGRAYRPPRGQEGG